MKQIKWIVIVFFFTGCSTLAPEIKQSTTNDTASPVTGDTPSDIPPGAIREKFADNADLEKVTLKDGSGQLAAEGTMLKGIKEGVWAELNSNGTVKSVTPYVNGKKKGWYVELNSNGQFTKRILYHNNMRNGEDRKSVV